MPYLSDAVELSLEVPVGLAVRVLHENLDDVGLGALGRVSDHGVVERNISPPDDLEMFMHMLVFLVVVMRGTTAVGNCSPYPRT